MTSNKYLYKVNYQTFDEPLWALESRMLFGQVPEGKVFESSRKVIPSTSAYIKNRIEILFRAPSFEDLLNQLQHTDKLVKNSKIKYIKMVSGDIYAAKRKGLYKVILAALSHCTEADDNQISYGVTNHKDEWLFGILETNDGAWRQHSARPHTYSNSLKGHLAKVLVNAAGQGDLSRRLVDPLCGAGTVLLEACYAGYMIDGSDINEKMVRSAKNNLKHFDYSAHVTTQKIEAIDGHYDGAIIDLPYGLYSQTTAEKQEAIIAAAKGIADRVVIVSSEDIESMIESVDLVILDWCKVLKTKNKSFARYIWVCKSK